MVRKHPRYIDGTPILIGDRIQLVYKNPETPSITGVLRCIESYHTVPICVVRFEHEKGHEDHGYQIDEDWPKIQKVSE